LSVTDYYDDHAAHPDAARRVGWRNALGQTYRFQLVGELLDALGGEARLDAAAGQQRLLDVGCGLGDLFGFLRRTSRRVDYRGIDVRQDFVEAARRRHPDARFSCVDYLDGPLERAEFVVAIGALVGGESEDDRLARLRQMVEVCAAAASRAALFVVLRAEEVEARPVLSLDPALVGATASELREAGRATGRPVAVRDVLAAEGLLLVGEGATGETTFGAVAERLAATFALHPASRPVQRALLAAEAKAPDVARRQLDTAKLDRPGENLLAEQIHLLLDE